MTGRACPAAGGATMIFVVAVLLVFLVLAAQYEAFTLPLAVILIVPMCLLAAIVGVNPSVARTTLRARTSPWLVRTELMPMPESMAITRVPSTMRAPRASTVRANPCTSLTGCASR